MVSPYTDQQGQVIKMRIDSCRNCGTELKIIELCQECDQPLHFQCENCRKFVEDPIHHHEKMIGGEIYGKSM